MVVSANHGIVKGKRVKLLGVVLSSPKCNFPITPIEVRIKYKDTF